MPAEESQRPASSEGASPLASWVEQTQSLTQAWNEAQSRIWTDWLNAMRPATELPQAMADAWMQHWQALAKASLGTWSTTASDTARDLMENLLSGERVFLSVAEMTLNMMKAVAPAIDVGEDWMDLLRRFVAQVKQDLVSGQAAWMRPEALSAASADVSELWRLYAAELQRLYGPWASAYAEAARHLAAAGRGDATALTKTYAGFFDAYELSFGRFLSAPAVGYTRESSERLLRSFDAWVDMNRAAADFQTEIANEGLRAVEALVARLVEMGEKGEKITSLRQLFDLWSDTVDSVYYRLFGSESFAKLQGRFVNASMAYRRRQAELLDEAMEIIGLPGRKEIDQVHARVHDLRRKVRALTCELSALRAELQAHEAAARQAVAESRERGAAAAEAAAKAQAATSAEPATTVKPPSTGAKRPRKAGSGDTSPAA